MAENGTVSAADLGQLLGIDEQSVRRLARKNIIVRAGYGRYALGQSIKAYCVHLRAEAERRLGQDEAVDPVREGVELSRAKKTNIRLLTDRLAEKTISIDALPSAWTVLAGTVRRMQAGIPIQAKRALPNLSDFDIATLETVIARQIADSGFTDDAPPPLPDRPSSVSR